MDSLTQITSTLQTLFAETAEQLARQTGLVKRASKLSGRWLLLILVIGFMEQPAASYNYLVQFARDLGLKLTKAALAQKLATAAIEFMRRMFEQSLLTLHHQLKLPNQLLQPFKALYLIDSTHLALPATLSEKYPASGGKGPKAGLKLQTKWNLLTAQLESVVEQRAREPDRGHSDYLANLAKGSLVLFDLGYFVLASLQSLILQEVYFICRLDPNTNLYDPQSAEQVDLLGHLESCQEEQIELKLLVGAKERLALRVVAQRLPPEVVAQRLARAQAAALTHKRVVSERKVKWLHWNIWLSNVPLEHLGSSEVGLVYRLRWQIELLFKLWKSGMGLNRVAGRKEGRILCEIYAKLIGFVVLYYLSGPVWLSESQQTEAEADFEVEEFLEAPELTKGKATVEEELELSLSKALISLRRVALKLGRALSKGSERKLRKVIKRLHQRWRKYGRKESRASRPSTLSGLEEARRLRPTRAVEAQAQAQAERAA